MTDPLASGREVILFDNAGIGRSSGEVPETVAGMATHVMAFLDGLGLPRCDVLGFSLGGMIAYGVLQKIFFAPTTTSQAAGGAFIARLMQRKDDREPPSGPNVAKAQMAAFREWERFTGERFADLKSMRSPTLVVQGFHDEMIPVRNSFWLAENLPNATLLAYPDAGHGSLFQYPESFTRQAAAFLSSDSDSAAF